MCIGRPFGFRLMGTAEIDHLFLLPAVADAVASVVKYSRIMELAHHGT